MPDAPETLQHALKIYEESIERLHDLEKAVAAMQPGNEYVSSVKCALTVRQGLEFIVDVETQKEFLLPLIEAEMIRERDAVARITRKLEAAREAMQRA